LESSAGPRVAAAVEEALRSLPGVRWAVVDPALGRVVVEVVDGATGPDRLVEVVGRVEASLGVGGHRFDLTRAEHPGDVEPVRRHLLALGADTAGLSVGVVGRLLRATPLPVELASLASFVDHEPRLRRSLESRLGTPATDLGLAVANAVGQGLSQGPIGLVADAAHRVNLLLEALARRAAFERAEQLRWGAGPPRGARREQLGPQTETLPHPAAGKQTAPAGEQTAPAGKQTAPAGEATPTAIAPAAPPERPRPLPPGPVERYVDRALVAGAATAAATFVGTRSTRRAADVVVASIPKAARLGREAFAAHLDRLFSERDLLVLDQRVLRRFDRVDTLLVDGSLLPTGRFAIKGVRLVGDADPPEVHRHLSALFDPSDPSQTRARRGWEIGPPSPAERRRVALRRAADELGAELTVVLRRRGTLSAVVGVDPDPDPAVVHLLRRTRALGLEVVLSTPAVLAVGVDADRLLPGGEHLADTVGALQAEGRVVAVVTSGAGGAAGALRGADVGLELAGLDGSAWSGHLVLNEVGDVLLVVEAIASARQVSRQSVALSATGSGIGALLALGAAPARAATRASSAVNLAALASMANGLRAAGYLARHGGRLPRDTTRWHELSGEETLARLASAPGGLSAGEATARREALGEGGPARPSLPRSVLAELVNPLTPVLAGGAAASAVVGSPLDGAIIAAVSGLGALVGGVQRFVAERSIAALSEASRTTTTVRRHGRASEEPAEVLVPGDVIELQAGDAVPADCRLLDCADLDVDESSLTGESEPTRKRAEPTHSSVLAERTSMLYEGTALAAGRATAVVVAVGPATASNAADAFDEDSGGRSRVGVEARLAALTSLTLPIAGGSGAAVLGLGLLRGRPLRESVGAAVALAVAAVPEGLPVLATMAQLASARRLSRRGALVRNPRAVEALGRVRVLCTDKTGTLTEGNMRLRAVSDGVGDAGIGDLADNLRAVVAAGLRASPAAGPDGSLAHLTDRAVHAGAARAGVDCSLGAPGWSRVAEVPFDPVRGYHAVLGSVEDGGLLCVKGAPETILPRCRAWRAPTGEVALRVGARRSLERCVEGFARRGLRVLAVAEADRSEPPGSAPEAGGALDDEDVTGLTLVGFLVLADPVRATAAGAVADLRRAGVEVVMVTGDHPSTAEGIAAELGILDGRAVLTGGALAAMSDAELDRVVAEVSVFARVTPADKVRVVRALQRRGAPVAMTGDGANDAPAIRLADVGIALGGRASPAARRAADVVVTDERIETIVDAIVEGRAMWSSLRDALAILLGGNLGEVGFTVAVTALTGAAPLSARQLLAVNLLTDVAPALAIALREPPSLRPEALLDEGPDASLGHRLDRAITLRATCTALGAGLAWGGARLTGRRQRAGTAALVALVGSQLGQTVVAGRGDPVVLLAATGSAAVLAGIVQTPGLSQFFGCTPLGPVAWSIAVGSSLTATAVSLALPALAPAAFGGPSRSRGDAGAGVGETATGRSPAGQ